MKSKYDYYADIQNKKLLVMNGHLDLLKQFNVEKTPDCTDYTEQELDDFLRTLELPFAPHDYQIQSFKDSILRTKQINKCCTGSGKSLIICFIAEFFRRNNKKGLLLVPNINLLTQMKEDAYSYNLIDLYNEIHVIGGGQNDKHFNNSLTISTWQSLLDVPDEQLSTINYIIADELQRFASDCTSDIIKRTGNSKYKFGFTGTVPDDPCALMTVLGLFGLPKTYITSKELIQRKLGTPININSIVLNYNNTDKKLFKESGDYPKQLKFIKEHEKRNNFIVKLGCKLKGNSLVLFQHTDHGKLLFTDIMKEKHPGIEVLNKDITGKKSFEFQNFYHVYFINGEINGEKRELIRNILETHDDAILVANYSCLSTGVNIKKLHNMIFASPMKSFTTVTQSIGRLMRLHKDKKEANVYDLVDNIGFRNKTGIFYKQYKHRINTSYNPEEYPIKEMELILS